MAARSRARGYRNAETFKAIIYLLAGRLPLTGRLIFVSGRAGYELIQKARASIARPLQTRQTGRTGCDALTRTRCDPCFPLEIFRQVRLARCHRKR